MTTKRFPTIDEILPDPPLSFLTRGEEVPPPFRGTPDSAGLDLISQFDYRFDPGERKLVSTGISVIIPAQCVGLLTLRSSIAIQRGFVMLNAPGIIDSDYRGPICCALMNVDPEPQYLRRLERIAQLIIIPYLRCVPEEHQGTYNSFANTTRGEGGFGSTGEE